MYIVYILYNNIILYYDVDDDTCCAHINILKYTVLFIPSGGDWRFSSESGHHNFLPMGHLKN